jgi:hypothetical protein
MDLAARGDNFGQVTEIRLFCHLGGSLHENPLWLWFFRLLAGGLVYIKKEGAAVAPAPSFC